MLFWLAGNSTQFPFGRVEVFDWSWVGVKSVFDPGAIMFAGNIWKSDTGILVDLTKDILDIDPLEWPSSDVRKIKASFLEFDLLAVRHDSDNFGFSVFAER